MEIYKKEINGVEQSVIPTAQAHLYVIMTELEANDEITVNSDQEVLNFIEENIGDIGNNLKELWDDWKADKE